MTYSIRFVKTPQDLAKCHEVRFEVFSNEQGYDRDLEVDEIDPECLHWVVVDQDEKPVGTARLYKYSPTSGKVGRVAVLSSTRGSGLGRLLMEEIEKYSIENTKIETLFLSSQYPRRGFYEKFGYITVGDIYPDEGQPHIRMERSLLTK